MFKNIFFYRTPPVAASEGLLFVRFFNFKETIVDEIVQFTSKGIPSQMFFKTGVFEIFANLIGKHLTPTQVFFC